VSPSGSDEGHKYLFATETKSSEHTESPSIALSFDFDPLFKEGHKEFFRLTAQRTVNLSANLHLPPNEPETSKFCMIQWDHTALPAPSYEEIRSVDRRGILRDYAVTLVFEQSYRLFRSNVNSHLDGPFFPDYIDSISHIKDGFWDGDTWYWNLVMHPISGGVSYHQARTRGASPLESFLWGVAYSVHWELSPLGQAGIGNNRISPVDLLLTPTAGVAWITMEDWLDTKIDHVANERDQKILRCLLPAKMFSNLVRFRAPWSRKLPD
jgi:hypothetical protein